MQPQHVLFVGGTDADAERIVEVLRTQERTCQVTRVTTPEEVGVQLRTLLPITCLIVSLDEGVPSAPTWRRVLDDAGLELPLLVLCNVEQEPTVVRWLTEGANDWLFRPHLAGLLAVLARLERERAEGLAHETMEQRWRNGTSELVQLTRHPSFQGRDLNAAFAVIDEAGVRGMQVARCGVWLFDEKREFINQADLYDGRTRTHPPGARVAISAMLGQYFERLKVQRFMSVADLVIDPRTSELIGDYFTPNGVRAAIIVFYFSTSFLPPHRYQRLLAHP